MTINNIKINKYQIPQDVLDISKALSDKNFDSYLVGGCVRDLMISREPKDWDITTNAIPEEIIEIFGIENTIYENEFGTVGVKIRNKIEKE